MIPLFVGHDDKREASVADSRLRENRALDDLRTFTEICQAKGRRSPMSSGLELDDRRRKIGKATDPSLRTVQSTGLTTARADLDRRSNANSVKAFFLMLIKVGLVGTLVWGAYFAYQRSEHRRTTRPLPPSKC
ncbi:MAG: hypothetical protein GY822_03220 [Deltaproteobacteria bacterium]|nr:hypothetical protein [Deltaproteobacteria bacterium]